MGDRASEQYGVEERHRVKRLAEGKLLEELRREREGEQLEEGNVAGEEGMPQDSQAQLEGRKGRRNGLAGEDNLVEEVLVEDRGSGQEELRKAAGEVGSDPGTLNGGVEEKGGGKCRCLVRGEGMKEERKKGGRGRRMIRWVVKERIQQIKKGGGQKQLSCGLCLCRVAIFSKVRPIFGEFFFTWW